MSDRGHQVGSKGLGQMMCAGLLVFAATLAARAVQAECDGQRAMQRFAARLTALEACVGLHGTERLRVRFEPTAPCPTSGQRCCLATDKVMECSDGSGEACGAAGRFDPHCLLIRLPQECDTALEHEAIHGLLYLNGIGTWAEHTHPAFRCDPENGAQPSVEKRHRDR